MKDKFQGSELKQLRDSIGFNQTQFSELTGVHQASISKYESNKHEMSYNLFRDIQEKVNEYKQQNK